MKKSLLLLAVLLALGAAAYFLRPQSGSGIDTWDRKFAYDGTISKIEVHKVGTSPQSFELRKGKWYVNDQLVASYKITSLLKAITSSRIENLPPSAGVPVIFNSIKKNGVSVKVYDGSGKEVRSYSVGPDATNSRCSYFLMDGSKQPYCMNISGFGSMRTRFVQETAEWRDVALYRVPTEEIASLRVEYNKDYTSSFEIIQSGSSIEVLDIGGKTLGKAINEDRTRSYLSEFNELYGEGYDNYYEKTDSIKKLLPFATITMKKTDGSERSIRLFPMAELRDPTDEVSRAQEAALHIQKYFVDVSNGDFMVAQQKLLKNVLRPYDFFLAE